MIDLPATLAKCQGGETVKLDATLANVTLRGFRFDKPVTITGSFSNAAANSRQEYAPALTVTDCKGLRLVGSAFTGTVTDGAYSGTGVAIELSENIAVEESTFRGLWKAISSNRTSGLKLLRNTMDDLGPFGIQIGGAVTSVEIGWNEIRNFHVNRAIGEHDDAIMILSGPPWGAASEWARQCARGVFIHHNAINGTANDGKTQGIFLRDAGNGAAVGKGFDDIRIEDNLILNPGWRAISWEGVERDLYVRRNFCSVIAGQETVARITGTTLATEITGNSANIFIHENGAGVIQPTGNTVVKPVSADEATRLWGEWKAKLALLQDPRPARLAELNIGIPIDTAARDALTRKLAKDRAERGRLEKALATA